MGPGLDPASELSPLSSGEQRAVVERYVAIGLDEGATLACGGKRLEGKGFFFEPTVFVDVDNGMRIAQEEIFGPVLVVIPFDTEDEAIRIANDTVFGLTAGVWTSDQAKAERYVSAVRAGTVFVNNTWACAPLGLPWGGYKQSGIGREIGDVGIEEFTELKAVIFAGASSASSAPGESTGQARKGGDDARVRSDGPGRRGHRRRQGHRRGRGPRARRPGRTARLLRAHPGRPRPPGRQDQGGRRPAIGFAGDVRASTTWSASPRPASTPTARSTSRCPTPASTSRATCPTPTRPTGSA